MRVRETERAPVCGVAPTVAGHGPGRSQQPELNAGDRALSTGAGTCRKLESGAEPGLKCEHCRVGPLDAKPGSGGTC